MYDTELASSEQSGLALLLAPPSGHFIGCDNASHDRRIQEVFWLHKAEAHNLVNLKVFLGENVVNEEQHGYN